MSQRTLSAGICKWFSEASPDEINQIAAIDSGYTVQVLSVIKVVARTTSAVAAIDRYRLILSDGDHFVQAMLVTELNDFVTHGAIVKHAIIVVDKLTCNLVDDKRLIVIHELHVVSRDEEKIGNPVAPPSVVSGNTATENPEVSSSMTSSSPPSVSSGGPAYATTTTRQGRFVPIEGLNPYQNNWTIKARCTHKTSVKTWSNPRGEGKLFGVTLMDETGEIRATAFNTAVDQLYDQLEEGRVYYISKARVEFVKKKFSDIRNDYEVTMERNTEIEECLDTTDLPAIRYNFVPLSSLEVLQKDSICDVIAIVREVRPLEETISKVSNKPVTKRDLVIVDRSLYSARLTIWGRQAETFTADDLPVIAFKGVKVKDFGGRSLSMLSSSYMMISPDIKEAHVLRGWYDSAGMEQPFRSYSNLSSGVNNNGIRYLSDVKDSRLGLSDTPDIFSSRATIMHINHEFVAYCACPTQGCSKKVTETAEGWRCERCEKMYEHCPEYRYNLSITVADQSGSLRLQGFNDAGRAVFEKTADELMEIKEHDQGVFRTLVAQSTGKNFDFTCRAEQNTYNDQTCVKYTILKTNPVDYYREARHLYDLIMESSKSL